MHFEATGVILANVAPRATDGCVDTAQLGPPVEFLFERGCNDLHLCRGASVGHCSETACLRS